MSLARNKWTGKLYIVCNINGSEVTLQRDDDSQFTIKIAEYKFNYTEVKNECKNQKN